MRLIIWIVEPDPATCAQLQSAWQTVAGDLACLHLFSRLPSASASAPPDLLMAEIEHQCDKVTHLLLSLRRIKSTDFLPVTRDTSPSSFTRSQQLGAIDYILKPFTTRRLRQSLRRYVSLKQGLSAGCALTQSQLDRFFYSGVRRKQLTSLALSESEAVSCKRLLGYLLSCEDHACTAAAASQALSFSRVTARKYLELLVSLGYVSKVSSHGGAGRPQYIYQLKEQLL